MKGKEQDRAAIKLALFEELQAIMGAPDALAFREKFVALMSDGFDEVSAYVEACACYRLPYKTARRIARKTKFAAVDTVHRRLKRLDAAGRVTLIPMYQEQRMRGNQPMRLVLKDKP